MRMMTTMRPMNSLSTRSESMRLFTARPATPTCYYREDYCGYRDFLEYAAPDMISIARTLR